MSATTDDTLTAAAPELLGVLLDLDAALKAGTAFVPHRVMARMVAVLANVGRPGA